MMADPRSADRRHPNKKPTGEPRRTHKFNRKQKADGCGACGLMSHKASDCAGPTDNDGFSQRFLPNVLGYDADLYSRCMWFMEFWTRARARIPYDQRLSGGEI